MLLGWPGSRNWTKPYRWPRPQGRGPHQFHHCSTTNAVSRGFKRRTRINPCGYSERNQPSGNATCRTANFCPCQTSETCGVTGSAQVRWLAFVTETPPSSLPVAPCKPAVALKSAGTHFGEATPAEARPSLPSANTIAGTRPRTTTPMTTFSRIGISLTFAGAVRLAQATTRMRALQPSGDELPCRVTNRLSCRGTFPHTCPDASVRLSRREG